MAQPTHVRNAVEAAVQDGGRKVFDVPGGPTSSNLELAFLAAL